MVEADGRDDAADGFAVQRQRGRSPQRDVRNGARNPLAVEVEDRVGRLTRDAHDGCPVVGQERALNGLRIREVGDAGRRVV